MTERRPRVVAVAVVPARRAAVTDRLATVVQAGGSALLITADGSRPPAEALGIEAIDLLSSETRVGVNAVLSRSLTRRIRYLLARRSHQPSGLWRAWSGSALYRAIRPWMLWRALHRHLDEVDAESVDHVMIVALESWPITWQLCRRQPQATYGWDVPEEVFERHGLTAPQRADA